MNGGKPVYVPLRAPEDSSSRNISSAEWKLDINELESKITPRTKIIVLNTPHNPIGKVFDENELRAIGKVAEKHNLIILSDEVVSCFFFIYLFIYLKENKEEEKKNEKPKIGKKDHIPFVFIIIIFLFLFTH